MKRARSVSCDTGPARRAVHRDQVEHPRRLLLGRARPARARGWRSAARQHLGLHEQLAERRVRGIGRRWREHDLGVAGELDACGATRLRLVMRSRRSSMSSSGETTISV